MLYLYYMYEFQQQKSQRYPTLQQRLASNSSALDVPPTPRSKKPSSWSDFSLLASAKRIAAWHHDTKVIFENLPHLFLGGVEGWIAKEMIWKSDSLTFTLGYNSGLPVFVGIISFEMEVAVGGKLYEIGFFDPPRSNISTYQIIAMPFTTVQSYQTLTVPEVGRWTYAKRLGWKLFHAATSNLVCEQDFDSFEVVLGVFCQYL